MTTLKERFARLGAPDVYSDEALAALEVEFAAIRRLKAEQGAIILAHNYQRPEVLETADIIGDSLELAREATKVAAPVVIFCGVHFMAETAKILNPGRKVILPNLAAGCSLAESADARAVAARAADLRRQHPDLAVVSYVNTTAAVKAVSDYCVTSGNAVKIVNAIPNDPILFVPDRNLAAYVAANTTKTILPWDGDCYVHQQIRPDEILAVKAQFPRAKVMVHPECRTDVLHVADAVLSTAGMIAYAKQSDADEFIVVTECGLSDRLLMEVPGKRFYKSCKLCQYMKLITLADTRRALERLAPEITLPAEILDRARLPITRMLELS